jgi:peptide/nickel transport system permease protein
MADEGTALAAPEAGQLTPRTSEWRRFRRVFLGRGVVVFGMVIIILFLLAAVLAPLIAPYDPYKQDLGNALSQPSLKHLLGTDAVGRDTLSRVIHGARTSLVIGLIVITAACAAGMALGLVAAYYGGWTYLVVMRIIDALMSFPMVLLALVVAALLGSGLKNVIVALCIANLPIYTRLMCAQVLSVKENDYILAMRSMGASNLRIMLRHVTPNCFPPLIVLITMMLGTVILAEASLSFLGIGITSPTAAWGSMVNDGRQYLLSLPVLSLAPGLAIMLVVFAFNMVGDGLRDTLDPRLRGLI